MSVKTNYYASSAADTNRGPSPSLWQYLNVEDAIQDPSLGIQMFDDFVVGGQLFSGTAGQTASGSFLGSVGNWGVWSDQFGTFDVDPNLEGGMLAITSGAHSGVNVSMQGTAPAFGFISGATGFPFRRGRMVFECRVGVTSVTTGKRDCFIGLMDATSQAPITATNGIFSGSNALNTVPGLCGFHFRATTNPTDVGFAWNVAGGTVQYGTGLQTLINTVTGAAGVVVASTSGATTAGMYKLGFVFDPTGGIPAANVSVAGSSQTVGQLRKPVLQVFVNGVPCATFLDADHNIQVSTFPSTWLAPTIGFCSRSGTAPGDFYVDWIRCAQQANS
jgi:hypothetical protein